MHVEAHRGEVDGRWQGVTYFEAPEYSSVFTTINHLYMYDEDEDIEQIRQKIGIIRAITDQQQAARTKSKKTVWRKFEQDLRSNLEREEQVLGQHGGGSSGSGLGGCSSDYILDEGNFQLH